MLKYTLILPPEDDLAVRLLQDAVDTLDVILLIVIGRDEQWVNWADQLAARGQGSGLVTSFRRVVWIRQPGTLVTECLAKCLNGHVQPGRGVMVLNFHDRVCAVLQPEEIRPLTLEEAFIKGSL